MVKQLNRILLSSTTPSQSGLGNDGNGGVLPIPQSSSITGASSSDFLVSYHGFVEEVLPPCKDAVRVFCHPSRLGQPDQESLHYNLIISLNATSLVYRKKDGGRCVISFVPIRTRIAITSYNTSTITQFFKRFLSLDA